MMTTPTPETERKATCSTCRWWTANEPYPRPEPYTAPTGWRAWFSDPFVEGLRSGSAIAAALRWKLNNDGGVCRRMPSIIQKAIDDWCGEHHERTGNDG